MKFNEVINKVKNTLGQIPLVGYLSFCGIAAHKAAARDFFISCLFATATFWFSAFILLALVKNADQGYMGTLYSTVSSGELFIFAVGFMGPILVTAIDDPKNASPFPGKIWHILLLLGLALLSAGCFALIKTAAAEQSVAYLDYDFLFRSSLWIAGIAAVLRYLTIVYRNQTLNPERDMKTQEKTFLDEYEGHHDSGQAK